MPKAFTKEEKEKIDIKLVNAAIESLKLKGIKATTVSELTQSVLISKGEFYQFYPSKEALFFRALETIQKDLKASLFHMLSRSENPKKELIPILMAMKENIEQHPFILKFKPEDFKQLQKKLDPKLLEQHFSDDDDAAKLLISLIDDTRLDPILLSGVLRLLFLSLLHKNDIGENLYDDVFEFILKSIFKEIHHD